MKTGLEYRETAYPRDTRDHRPSQSWSSRPEDCDVRLMGVTPAATPKAKAVAKQICDAVKLAVPEAGVICTWMPPVAGASALHIIVRVSSDELATLYMGSMHRKAIGRARKAACVNECWWEFAKRS